MVVILAEAKGSLAETHRIAGKRGQCLKQYYVYIMVSISRTLYIGLTSNLEARVYQHRNKTLGGFTAKYNVTRLVFIEEFNNPQDAIARERQLKRRVRAKKVGLIKSTNPEWDDLSMAWEI